MALKLTHLVESKGHLQLKIGHLNLYLSLYSWTVTLWVEGAHHSNNNSIQFYLQYIASFTIQNNLQVLYRAQWQGKTPERNLKQDQTYTESQKSKKRKWNLILSLG